VHIFVDHESGYKFQATSIIVHILTSIGTKAHTTSHTSVISRKPTNSAEVATGGWAWRSNCGFPIGGHVRWQWF